MIRILAQEQWRFQRMYVTWTTVIVTAAVGFATFAAVSAATQGALDQYSDHVLLSDAPHNDAAVLTDFDSDLADDLKDYGTPLTSGELTRVIDAANADGAVAYAHSESSVTLITSPGTWDRTERPWPTTVSAVWGQPDWESILADGTAPGPGEIVLPAGLARDLNVGIGDIVHVGHDEKATDGMWRFASDGELTVSGLARDITLEGYQGYAYASHHQLPMLNAAQTHREPDGIRWTVQAFVGWQHPTAALEPFSAQWDAPSLRTFGSSAALPWLLAALFTVGSIVAAFTLGRAQAASRVRWIATSRALGAQRSHLLGVGALEWALVGGVGALAGVGMGVGAAAMAHAHRMASLVAPPPVAPSVPFVVLAAMVALAALLAAAVVGVPSILALRVPPTAALKDTAAADTAKVSRQVRFWPVAAIFSTTLLATVGLYRDPFPGSAIVAPFAALASVVAGVAVLVESCRVLVNDAAKRLSRSPRPTAIHASMTMTGHPQQIAALAMVQALVMLVVSSVIVASDPARADVAWIAHATWSEWSLANRAEVIIVNAIPEPLTAPTVLALLVATQFLAGAISASARRVAWSETSTAGALGLTGSRAARGDTLAWWVAQALGAAVGLVMGVVGTGAVWFFATEAGGFYTADYLLREAAGRAATAGVIALVSLGIAVVVARVLGVLLRPRVRGAVAHRAP